MLHLNSIGANPWKSFCQNTPRILVNPYEKKLTIGKYFEEGYVLKRYIKLSLEYCREEYLLDKKFDEIGEIQIAIHELPLVFPKPREVCMFITPTPSQRYRYLEDYIFSE
ncbi:MAG: hypothetical protein WCK35_17335 [Chloroflexota bacterium]